MGPQYDAIVGGGSIAGLCFAAEAAKRGLSVLVLEEHDELGEPEKCDGLVSLRSLNRYGYAPRKETVQNQIASGLIHSPSGREFAINATSLEIVVLDRSAYDAQVGAQAEAWGAEVRRGTRVVGVTESGEGVSVGTGKETFRARYYIDSTGPASAPRSGIIPAAKYEIEAEWIRERVVEVFLDAEKYPGFFAWVIPYGNGVAKVGAAGRGINAFAALDKFLSTRRHRVIRKVAAPIYVGGPVRSFVSGRKVYVGESAGMVKPTTAGGIVTSIVGAVVAARWLGDSIFLKDASLLGNYQTDWDSRFGKEMRNMKRLRGLFEQLSNAELESLVQMVSTPKTAKRLANSDFDYHATALLGVLGVGGILKLTKIVASAEARDLLKGWRNPMEED
jgi:digeranylgeranylglycerophospholipid reductase